MNSKTDFCVPEQSLTQGYSAEPSMLQLARLSYPGKDFASRRKRWKFWLRALCDPQAHRQLFKTILDLQLMPVLQAHPRILQKLQRPYAVRGWNAEQTLAAIQHHYRFMQSLPLRITDAYHAPGILLGSCLGIDHQILEVRLAYLDNFEKEGELTLGLVTAAGRRLFTAGFVICAGDTGKSRLLLTSLQGPCGEDAHELTKQLTKIFHGLRPKMLLINLLQCLSRIWGIHQIDAVSDAHHVSHHRRYRFRAARVKARHDDLFTECGGIRNGETFVLPVHAESRPLTEIASHKRAQYRRRYQWLAQLQQQISHALTAEKNLTSMPVRISSHSRTAASPQKTEAPATA